MRERELRELIVEEFLAFVDDPRVERTRKHSLENIVVISLLGVICGADSFMAIERFAKAKLDWLETFLDLPDGVPSHDTIGRVFAALQPKALGEAFRKWTLALSAASKETVIAIDGKTLRRSFKHAGDSTFVHMVSAWSARNRVVLGQTKTDNKGGELAAIIALLDVVEVRKTLVTIDAAGTHVEVADKIVEHGGDYVLAVKGNQPTLHAAVIEHFADAEDSTHFGEHQTEGKAHGRRELRRAWVSSEVASVDPAGRWPKLATMVRLQSTRIIGDKQSTEDRYYISSRPHLSAIEAMDAVRSHWSIENELHWVLDMAFREDDCRVRADNAAANFSIMRQHALGLLKQRTEAKCGIKNRRLMAGWDHGFLLRVLGVTGGN